MITRQDFHINALYTTVQGVAAAFLATQIVGRLGHFAVTLQPTALIIGVVAATLAAVAENVFHDHKKAGYLALPVGVLAGAVVHHILIPTSPFAAILGLQEVIVLTATLALSRFAFDKFLWPLFETAEETAEQIATEIRYGIKHLAHDAKHLVHRGAQKLANATNE